MCRDHSLRQSVSRATGERSFSMSNYTVKHNKIKGEQKYFVYGRDADGFVDLGGVRADRRRGNRRVPGCADGSGSKGEWW